MTEPIDFETEKQLYRLEQRLYEKFPNTLIDVWVLNLRLSDSPDLSFLVPRNAKLFDLS